MKSTYIGGLILALVIGIAVSIYTSGVNKVDKDIKAKYLKGGEIALSNEGKPFTLTSLQGQPVVLYFGFTFCPDVCPVGLATIRDALKSSESLAKVPAIFITLDPERDSRARLEEYTAFFHANIVGLTGSLKEIQDVAKRYGTYFQKSPKKDAPADDYLVDHTAYFYLIDANGELTRVLDHNASAQEISDLLLKML